MSESKRAGLVRRLYQSAEAMKPFENHNSDTIALMFKGVRELIEEAAKELFYPEQEGIQAPAQEKHSELARAFMMVHGARMINEDLQCLRFARYLDQLAAQATSNDAQDAERYRWLRDWSNGRERRLVLFQAATTEGLDSEIDRQIAAASAGKRSSKK